MSWRQLAALYLGLVERPEVDSQVRPGRNSWWSRAVTASCLIGPLDGVATYLLPGHDHGRLVRSMCSGVIFVAVMLLWEAARRDTVGGRLGRWWDSRPGTPVSRWWDKHFGGPWPRD